MSLAEEAPTGDASAGRREVFAIALYGLLSIALMVPAPLWGPGDVLPDAWFSALRGVAIAAWLLVMPLGVAWAFWTDPSAADSGGTSA